MVFCDRQRSARRPRRAWLASLLIAAAPAACSTADVHGGGRSSGRPVDPSAAHSSGSPGGSGGGHAGASAQSGNSTGSSAGNADAASKTPIGGADAGTYMPRVDLDPNVTFDWEEKAPGGTCQAGTYTGTFECEFVFDPNSGFASAPDSGSILVSGPITLHLEKSADGEFLVLANAQLEGVAQDVIGFMVDLSGKLDCTTLALTSQAQNGVFGLGLPIVIPTGTVTGTLTGKLNPQTLEITGDWMLTSDMSVGTCVGPWHATFTP